MGLQKREKSSQGRARGHLNPSGTPCRGWSARDLSHVKDRSQQWPKLQGG